MLEGNDMGHGYTKTCMKCGYSFNCNEGIGFMFPKVYAETVRKAKAGKFGKVLKISMKIIRMGP